MRLYRFLLVATALSSFYSGFTQKQPPLLLWYQQPAHVWTEALTLGNGRLGAMVFGNPQEEFLQLNESSLWSGSPNKENINPQAHSVLPQVRQALMEEEDFSKAEKLSKSSKDAYGYITSFVAEKGKFYTVQSNRTQ